MEESDVLASLGERCMAHASRWLLSLRRRCIAEDSSRHRESVLLRYAIAIADLYSTRLRIFVTVTLSTVATRVAGVSGAL